jgi:hypothetical protein
MHDPVIPQATVPRHAVRNAGLPDSSRGFRIAYVRAAEHAAARRKGPLVEDLRSLGRSARRDSILTTLRTHSLARLILGVLNESELRSALDGEIVDVLESWRRLPWVTHQVLLRGFDDARGALATVGVPVLLLKGAWFAESLYGGIDRRPQLDVDVLVHRTDYARSCRVLLHAGFASAGYDAHSRTFSREGAKLDLHRCLRNAPAYRLDEGAMWAESLEVAIGGLTLRTLSDEWHLVLLALGLLEDLGQGMAKVRQLLDLHLLLSRADRNLDWPCFLARRKKEGILGCVVNVFALTVALFEAENETARLQTALGEHRALIDAATVNRALDLVFSERKALDNLEWFARIYPGSMAAYLAAFWWGGFPANLGGAELGRLAASLRVARRRSGVGSSMIE